MINAVRKPVCRIEPKEKKTKYHDQKNACAAHFWVEFSSNAKRSSIPSKPTRKQRFQKQSIK